MPTTAPRSFYHHQVQSLEETHQKLVKKRNLLAWGRFACIVAVTGIVYFFSGNWTIAAPAIIALLVIFRWLILKDLGNKEAISHNRHLFSINKDELKALDHEFAQFDGGIQYQPHDHYYAGDLDIFGEASLFQFCNRTVSGMGADQLAEWLLEPAPATAIEERQHAVRELSNNISSWQQLQAFGKNAKISVQSFQNLSRWMKSGSYFTAPYFKWIRWVLPAISVAVTLATIIGWLPMNVFYGTMFIMFIIAGWLEKKIKLIHEQLGKMVAELDTLSKSIAHIETMQVKSNLLQQIQGSYTQGDHKASTSIQSLKSILDRLDLRFNIVLVVPLNLLFLWNFQQAFALERWKKQHGTELNNWFRNLGILEALGSFAVMKFNQPGYNFPTIVEEHFFIESAQMGHPLIAPQKRVNNDIHLEPNELIMLVTGSNMAGKSTYLRSVGVNTVLAMAGAPVCAGSFSISHVQLLSSMRITDNLLESTSTFYAELKKLKTIIEKVNAGEKVFILLDEILRGTNSLDRHAGSEALIKQLIQHKATAIIATHDLALASLEKNYPKQLRNYHFDVQVSGEELFFDYELKPGICTSMNASILMKKIGIEIV